MSGGSYDYACYKIEEIEIYKTDTDPRRAAFQKLLKLIAKPMHDIEWVDSCDYGEGDDHAAIDAVMGFLQASPETIAKAAAYDTLKDNLKRWLEL